jgi:hypothetical protein
VRFLHQVLVQDEALTVSTQRSDDLPVNPLSHILFTLRLLNNSADLDDYRVISALLAQISRVEVLFKGSAIIAGSLADLARMATFIQGRPPMQTLATIVDNDARSITVPIYLGRRPYWPEECFPAVRRGELQLQTTVAAAQTGVDTPTLQIETVELLEAKPSRFLKYTTISRTPAATGDHDVDLPIGNTLLGVLLFGTTAPAGAALTASIGQLRLLVDNVEHYFGRTNWETLHNMAQLWAGESISSGTHTVRENDAVAYTADALTDGEHGNLGFLNNYGFLNLDPNKDGAFALNTRDRSRIHMRINADVADAIRVLPLELLHFSGEPNTL